MIIKAIEIRDRATFIPALAIKMVPHCDRPDGTKPEASLSDLIHEAERYLLRRSGYPLFGNCFVILCRMEASGVDRNATYDPFAWGGGTRTYRVAHQYITNHFDELESGAVVDVEFICGETKEPKKSEREG